MNQPLAPSFEAHADALQNRVEAKAYQIDTSPSAVERESLVRNEIKDFVSHVQQNMPAATAEHQQIASRVSQLEPTQKVGSLITLVFQKGIHDAVNVAKNLNDPAILDEFHDMLVDNFYNELVKRGVVKVV